MAQVAKDLTSNAGYTVHHKIIGLILGRFLPFRQSCSDYVGGSEDYLIRFVCGVRCVKSDWICSEEC